MAALQYVNVPGYASLVLRRTYKDLALPGAIMDRAHEWLRNTPASWCDELKTYTFPSGATMTFGYLEAEGDKYRYQSSEFQTICWDELTQFSRTQYLYMLSRLRRLKGSSVPLRSRAASNPGGRGHRWVKERFVDDKTRGARVYVPASRADNPHLDVEAYERALDELDEVTKRQLKEGLWVEDNSVHVYHFSPEKNLVDELPGTNAAGRAIKWNIIFIVDFGDSQISPTEAIAVVAWSEDVKEVYVLEAHKHKSLTLDDIAELYRAAKKRYGDVWAALADQGGLGGKLITELRDRLAIPFEPCDKTSKLAYRKLFNADLERGRILVLDSPETVDWRSEADELVWDEKGLDGVGPDHATDAVLYGWRKARAYLSDPPKPKPTREQRLEEEVERMERRAEAIAKRERAVNNRVDSRDYMP